MSRALAVLEPVVRRALIARNVDDPRALSRALLTGHLQDLADLPISDRIAAWAKIFLAWGRASYVFGDAAGGYVAEGRLVDDHHTDCMLFMHRAVELAHATAPEDAIEEALARRYPGGAVTEIVNADGRVDGAHPARVAFAWELVERGTFGRDASADLGALRADVETARFAAGRVRYVRTADAGLERVRNGDILWFLLDERHPGAANLRRTVGCAIGHVGIAVTGDDRSPDLVHAASSPLPGAYEQGGVVRVPLAVYLERVERFKGLVVTRFGDDA